MPLHPLERRALVQQAAVGRSVRGQFFSGEEPEDVEAVADRDGDDGWVGLGDPVVEREGLGVLFVVLFSLGFGLGLGCE